MKPPRKTPSRFTLPGMAAIEQVRAISRTSMVVRTVLVSSFAIVVTIGSVIAGALVVAPVVARATQANASAEFAQKVAEVSATSSAAFSRGIAVVQNTLATLPAPVSQYGFPIFAGLALVSAMSTIFLRRRAPHRSLVPAQTSYDPSRRLVERLTSRSNQKGGGRNQKTPRAVEALAASGASSADIALRTGLPFDAVQLLIALANGPRQFQPPTA